LSTAALAGAVAAAGHSSWIGSAEAASEANADITSKSASELASAIRSRELSSKAIVEAHLEQIAKVNPKLNAIVQLTADSARKEADQADAALARGEIMGPLHGVPITIKDTLETNGVICTGGTKGRANFVPKADATAVARLRAAGGIILGKTNVPELAGAIETDNLVYGRTNNPYDLARTPGGSSGGESAIVAACGSPLGLGTDAGGSIRIPAHFCGLAAIKPTSGRVPRTGQFPLPIGGAQCGVSRQPDRAQGRRPGVGLADNRWPRLPRSFDCRNAFAGFEGGDIERIEAGLFRGRWRRHPDQGNQCGGS
jgi:amidase